jgi:glucose/arabinose dehydrogenase
MDTWRTSDLDSVTALALGPDGRLFVANSDGRILLLEDADHDGVSEGEAALVFKTFASQSNGLVYRGNTLYASNLDRIVALQDLDGDDVAEVENVIVSGMPMGAHWINGLRFGPDGKLYFALGSTCDLCPESDPFSATIMRCNANGSALEVFASGIRNCYDLDFNASGDLIAGDNSFNDGSTPTWPPDELNHVQFGKDYGWPTYTGDPPMGTATEAPIALLGAHTSLNGICFYHARQFPGMQGQALATLWGEFGALPTGMPLQQLNLQPDGGGSFTANPQSFVDGFVHPLDVVVDEVGDVYIADFGLAPFTAIYRLYFEDLEASGDWTLGGSLTFTMRGNPFDFYLLFASLGTAHIPQGENGIFRLDASSFFKFLSGTLPAAGEDCFTAGIPNDPALVGIPFHFQQARLFNSKFYFGVRATVQVTP